MSSRSLVRTETRRGKRRLVIDFQYVDASGRKQRYRHDAKAQHSKSAANAEAKRLMELAARTGAPMAVGKMPTLAKFVADTYRPVFMPHLREGTRNRYEGLLRQHVLELLGRRRMDAINEAPMLAFNTELLRRGVDPRGPGNLVRTLVRSAKKAGVIAVVPTLPSYRQPEKLPSAPSFEVVLALLASAHGWVRTAIALTAYAGLRQGEVRALQVRHVDFQEGILRICQAFSDGEIVDPKGEKDRPVPIAEPLDPMLRRAVRGKLPGAYVVTNRNGKVPTRQAVWTAVQTAADRAGIERRSHHSLRHFFCSRLVSGGVSVEVVRKLAGHVNLATTQRYLHATAADEKAAVLTFSGNNVATTRKRRR